MLQQLRGILVEAVGDGAALTAQAPPAAGLLARLPRIPHRGRTARRAAARTLHARQGGEVSCRSMQSAIRHAPLQMPAAPACSSAIAAPPALALSVSAWLRLAYPRTRAWPAAACRRRSPCRRRAGSFPPCRGRAGAGAGRPARIIHSPSRPSGTVPRRTGRAAPRRSAPLLDSPLPPKSLPPPRARPGYTQGSECAPRGRLPRPAVPFCTARGLDGSPAGTASAGAPPAPTLPALPKCIPPRPAPPVRDGQRM